MLEKLVSASQSKLYWLFLIVLGVLMEMVALYFQYGLDEWPCVLCIHVRILVMAFVIVSLTALLLQKNRILNSLSHLVLTLIMIALVERSWNLLGIERGWIFGSCDMDLGMPTWLALDKWFPALFEVQTPCGYTPQLMFGITWAGALMAMSGVLSLAGVLLTVGSFMSRKGR